MALVYQETRAEAVFTVLFLQFLNEGISEKIYYDTFYDLTIWCVWNKKYYGNYGMQKPDGMSDFSK